MPPKKSAPAFVPTDAPARNGGNAFVPDLGPVNRQAPVTRVDAQPPFLLKAHPERWTVMAGSIVPMFGRMVLQAGVGGVSARAGGKIDASDARNMTEERGWTLIPVDAIPDSHATTNADGQVIKSYLYRPEGREDVTLLRYTRCFPGSSAIEVDEAGYVEFCDYLQSEGYIQPPAAYALEKLRARMERESGELSDRAREHSQYAEAAKRAKDQLGVVEAALSAARKSPSAGSAVVVDA